MRLGRILALLGLIVSITALTGAATASAAGTTYPYSPEPLGLFAPLDRPGPALTPSVAAMADSMQCSGDLVDPSVTPVLLVPGTGASAKDNFGFSYEPALTDLHIPWCAITFPAQGNNNITINGEYVVYAIRTMYGEAGRRISIIGHSQGGMIPRWALRFWPDTRHMVDDQIGFAPPNQGTTAASPSCPRGCQISTTQQAAGSNFIHALDSGAETFAGISYTEVFSHDDEEVHPNQEDGDSATDLFGGGGMITDVSVQDVCPADVVEHLGIGTYDPVAYALAIDALSHPGPAIPTEIPRSVCNEKLIPAIDPLTFGPDAAAAAVDTEDSAALSVTSEPALPCYVYATGCGATRKASTVPACTQHRSRIVALSATSGTRVVGVNVYLNGRFLLHRSGHKLRRVALKGLPATGKYVVRVVTRDSDRSGRVVRYTFAACG
jgi:pimeloyl-ACP methyl ester carboxylesterase